MMKIVWNVLLINHNLKIPRMQPCRVMGHELVLGNIRKIIYHDSDNDTQQYIFSYSKTKYTPDDDFILERH